MLIALGSMATAQWQHRIMCPSPSTSASMVYGDGAREPSGTSSSLRRENKSVLPPPQSHRQVKPSLGSYVLDSM